MPFRHFFRGVIGGAGLAIQPVVQPQVAVIEDNAIRWSLRETTAMDAGIAGDALGAATRAINDAGLIAAVGVAARESFCRGLTARLSRDSGHSIGSPAKPWV